MVRTASINIGPSVKKKQQHQSNNCIPSFVGCMGAVMRNMHYINLTDYILLKLNSLGKKIPL